MDNNSEVKKPKRRIKKIVKSRRKVHRNKYKRSSTLQTLIILIAFLFFGYLGFNLILYLTELIF